MSFTDPITVAAHGGIPALTFSKMKSGNMTALYADTTEGYDFYVEHSDVVARGKKPEKHYSRLTQTKDVLLPSGAVSKQTASVSISVTIPPYGWTAAQKLDFLYEMYFVLTEGEAGYAKFLNYES